MKAVLFDLWETLIHDAPELGRARQLWRAANVRAVLEADDPGLDPDLVDKALSATSIALTRMHDRGVDTHARGRVELFVAEYENLGGATPDGRTHYALEEAICTMPEGLYPRRMEGAVETLAAIKARGLKTGLISNAGVTSAPTLRAMLEHYELLPLLDVCVFSDEAKAAKPSLALFETALAALGCDGGDAVFVGDSPLHDVAGARAAGMRTVVIGSKHVDGLDPDARIEDLPSLLAVLAGFDPALSF